YSRVSTGRTPSAVPSSSNFPASHLGSKPGLIAQSYRAFSSSPVGRHTRMFRLLFGNEPTNYCEFIHDACEHPVGSPWMWTLIFPHREGRSPTHGYAATRDARDGCLRKELATVVKATYNWRAAARPG